MLLVLGKQATAEESAQVISISVNGIASAQTLTVQLLRRGDRDARSEKLTVGSSLDAGTEISVPVGAQITLRSINGNELVVRGGTRVRLSRIGKTGEKYHIENGDISFKVVNALSFFKVSFREFLAIVRGTEFRIVASPNREYRCDVITGAVLLERPVRVKIAEGDRIVDFTMFEPLNAKERASATYNLSSRPVEGSFGTLKEAEDFFRSQTRQFRSQKDAWRTLSSLNAFAAISDLRKANQNGDLSEMLMQLDWVKSQGDSSASVAAANWRGTLLRKDSRFDEAKLEFEYSIKTLAIALNLFSDSRLVESYLGLAAIYRDQGNWNAAESTLAKAKQAAMGASDLISTVAVILARAKLHDSRKDYASAEKEARGALLFEKIIQNAFGVGNVEDMSIFATARYQYVGYARFANFGSVNLNEAETILNPAITYWRNLDSAEGQSSLADGYGLLGDLVSDTIKIKPSTKGTLSGVAADYYSRAIEARAKYLSDPADADLLQLEKKYSEQLSTYKRYQPDPRIIDRINRRIRAR